MLEFGGAGGITVASHLVGDRMREMWDAAQNGEIERARQIDAEITPAYEATSVTTNPIPLKAALAMLGLCAGPAQTSAGVRRRRAEDRHQGRRSKLPASPSPVRHPTLKRVSN